MKIKSIIFDLFGTLVSDAELKEKAVVLKKTLTEAEYVVFVKEWRLWHKNDISYDSFMRKLNSNLHVSQSKIDLIISRVTIDTVKPYADTVPILTYLKNHNYSLYLLSNAPPTVKGVFNNESQISSFFQNTFWSFELGLLKPDPEIFKFVAKQIGNQAEEILFVGDSYESDYVGAKKSGMQAVLLDRDGKSTLPEKINSLSELTTICL